MILYINACSREDSRTDDLARRLLKKLGPYEEVDLDAEAILPLNRERLEKRMALQAAGDFSDPMFSYAKQLMAADTIVIGAPYWDLSFPSSLKVYLENCYIVGLNVLYDSDNRATGLCKAERLYYVTTAGSPYDGRYSFDYVKDLFGNYLGHAKSELIVADALDLMGSDPEKILADAVERYGL